MTISLALGYPLIFFDRKYAFLFWRYLSILLGYIIAKVGRITYVIENEENILKEPAIYAIRHESTWETLVLIQKFKNPIFVLKEELLKIPLFGAMSKKVGTVAVDRSNGAKSLMNVVREVENSIKNGHPVVIFPEGTRMAYGEYAPLKKGISLFYKKADCPVIPVVHNSGRFWPRRGFVKKPGVIVVKFLDPIPPGLSKDEFMDRLNHVFSMEIEKLKAM
jgi:1-acyl-sn-glycerol-3-phosphate acyltransferase